MSRFVLIVLGAVAWTSAAVLLRGGAEMDSFMSAEMADTHFLTSQLRSLEGDLQKLERASSNEPLSALQLSIEPKASAANATKPAAKKVEGVHEKLAKLEKQSGAEGIMSKLGGKGAVNVATLAPMLAMLKGLYQEQKGRIAELNKGEEVNKKRFEVEKKDHEAKAKKHSDLFKNHSVNAEFYKNMTHTDDFQWNYIQRCRERNHRQFHTSLKLTHATMEKEKQMIKAYEEALGSPVPTAKGMRDFAKISGEEVAPEVDLVQLRSQTKKFCRSALAEVRASLNEMQ